MFSFKEILNDLPLPPEVKKSITALEIAKKNWKNIVPQEFFDKAIPLSFDNGTLIIEVPNHYYSQILSSRTLEILEKLENVTPPDLKPLFKHLKFVINPFSEKKNSKT